MNSVEQKVELHPVREFIDATHFPQDAPNRTLASMWEHALLGDRSGGFVTSVLADSLASAAVKADLRNGPAIPDIARHMTSYLPGACWGDISRVRRWRDIDPCPLASQLGTQHMSEQFRVAAGLDGVEPGRDYLAELLRGEKSILT